MTRDGAIVEVNETTADTPSVSANGRRTRIFRNPWSNRQHRTRRSYKVQLPRLLPCPMRRELPPKRTRAKQSASWSISKPPIPAKRLKKRYERHRQKPPPGRNLPACTLPTRNALPRSLKSISRNPIKPPTDLDKAKAAIPKEKKLVRKSAPLTKPPGKARPACTLRKRTSRPDLRRSTTRLSRPTQEAGILVHNKIHSVEKDNSGVEGAHKSEEAAERGD